MENIFYPLSPLSRNITYQGPLASYNFKNFEFDDLLIFLKNVQNIKSTYIIDNLGWDTIIPSTDFETYIIGCFGEYSNLKFLQFINDNYKDKKLILITSLYYNEQFNTTLLNFKIFYIEHIYTIKKFFLEYAEYPIPHLSDREYIRSILSYRFESIRLLFTSYILNVYPDTVFSFHKKNIPEFLNSLPKIIEEIGERYDYHPKQSLIENMNKVFQLPDKSQTSTTWSIKNDAYIKSKLHFVLESFYQSKGIEIFSGYLTEKTFKPIVAKMPFIVLGQADVYKKLINLGFQIFDDKFNFDVYKIDSLPDSTRIENCLNLIETINNDLINENIAELDLIANYNFNHFFNNLEKICKNINQKNMCEIIEYCND